MGWAQRVLPPRDVVLLALCQALLVTGNVLLVSVTALIGDRLAASPSLATLPVAVQFGGMMVATLPASLFMKRFGRRLGFVLGNLVGMGGALVCLLGLHQASLPVFCLGTGLLGVCIGTSQLYRFAAVDASPPEQKERAISLVMAGGVVAAVLGPNLAVWTRTWLPETLYGGSFLGLVLLYLLALALLAAVRIPPPSQEEASGPQRALPTVARQPVFLVAVAGAMVAYAVMALIMTATPLAMADRSLSFAATAMVIQWHVLGMFAPSFVTGRLVSRFGAPNIMILGSALMLACIFINLLGSSRAHFTVALLLLGVGWNFLYIAATSLVTEAYRPAEKAKVQGVNDLLVSSMVTLATFFAGALHNGFGWEPVNLAMLGPLLLVIVAVLGYRRQLQTAPRRSF
ncbi:MFS transporter [Motiliproteus sp. SC1-56]|uniref:MFS transporter n=1 Tax=Motiliproteus sp. SC1-56 TaxID=2799565 RepID=UPI001A8CEFDF|nr:MFS transporter [Motiliproteus sp. SC1-56]